MAVSGGSARLVDGRGRTRPLPLPLLARDLTAAAVHGGRLYLGTAGSGPLSRPLD